MFGSQKTKVKTSINAINSIIAQGTVTGPLEFTGAVKIAGKINGNVLKNKEVESKDETSVVVDPTGVIQGSVVADNVIIGGSVFGDIHAKSVFVNESAYIRGNITYEILQVEPGAQIDGALRTMLHTNCNTNTQPVQEAVS